MYTDPPYALQFIVVNAICLIERFPILDLKDGCHLPSGAIISEGIACRIGNKEKSRYKFRSFDI